MEKINLFDGWKAPLLIMAFSLCLCSSLSIVLLMKKALHHPTIVTVDLQALVKDEIGKLDIDKLEESQVEQRLVSLIGQKRAQVESYAALNRLIVFSQAVLLSKAPDITHLLKGKNNEKSVKKALALGCVLLSITFAVTHFTMLGINQSPSLPAKVFLTLKHSSFKRGDKVTIKGHKTLYYHDVHFTKNVAGTPGDRITIKAGGIYVNDKRIGALKKLTQHGKPLTPLKAKQIPKGYVFVAANHDRSFDSRYEEFGLVPIEKVVGRVIWSW